MSGPTNFGFCYKTALQYQWVKLKMQRERERDPMGYGSIMIWYMYKPFYTHMLEKSSKVY